LLPFDSTYFQSDTIEVARGLLGHYLCHETAEGLIMGKIVETEAYLAEGDPACHASRGMTGRNEVMFGPAGKAYVYFIYGNYFCFNVVTGKAGKGEAVLIRSVEPLEGLDLMRSRRGKNCPDRNLTSGPGKLCSAFAIDKRFNRHDLNRKPLFLARNDNIDIDHHIRITATPRIGLSFKCGRMLRFIVSGNQFLSRRE
jgi:DNA-3-methyladenine glycosylase